MLKIKPVFAITKLYKALGIPMFGMTANGKKFAQVVAKYLDLSDIFIDIATEEDMVGGGKEIIISKMIKQLEQMNIQVDRKKLIIVGDSLSGDIGSGLRFKDKGKSVFIKGILVMKSIKEYKKIKNQIDNNSELRKIIDNTDTEAFIIDNVKKDSSGTPLLFNNKNKFLFKL